MELTLSSYISVLPSDRQATFKDLNQKSREFILSQSDGRRDLMFNASEQHPSFEDNRVVFSQAFKEIMLPVEHDANELPFLYIGAHVASRISDVRDAIGFIFTDRGVYIQDDVKAIFAVNPPRRLLYQDYAQEDLSTSIIETFNWRFLTSLKEEISALLLDTVRFAYEMLQTTESDKAIPKGETAHRVKPFSERVNELGLSTTVHFAEEPNHKKNRVKIEKTFNLQSGEQLEWFVVDKILIIGSVYGLAVTNNAVYSKDFMEDPIRSAFTDIDKVEVVKEGIIVNDKIVHTLPAYLNDAQKNALLSVLKQFIQSNV